MVFCHAAIVSGKNHEKSQALLVDGAMGGLEKMSGDINSARGWASGLEGEVKAVVRPLLLPPFASIGDAQRLVAIVPLAGEITPVPIPLEHHITVALSAIARDVGDIFKLGALA